MKKIQMNRLSKKEFLISLVCIFVLFVLSADSAHAISDEYRPYLHNPSIGDVPKLESFGEYKTELFSGSGAYIYELDVPSGVIGLQPSLALNYNSQIVLQHPGLLGSGWSMTENLISRKVNYTVNQTNDDYFILSLGESRLKVIYNGSAYNTEINPRNYRIQNLTTGGRIYWTVTATDGTQYRFGFNNDSRLDSNTGMNYDVKWSLDSVRDTHNNSIVYSYRENPFAGDVGAVYLSNITYNNDRLRIISFAYEGQARPDRRLVFEEGNMLDESRRLKDISVLFNNSLVRRYSIGYATLNQTLTSVSNISYIGADNTSVLNTVKFEYYNPTQGFDNSTGRWIVPSAFAFSSTDVSGKDFGVRLLDVNNDGFPDLVRANGTRETRLNNKVNGWNTTAFFAMPVDIVSSNLDQGVRFEDVNSDGLVDILKAKAGISRTVYLNNGTGWASAASWVIPIDFIASDSKDLGVELVDLNGDGRVDILKANTTTKAAYLNNGTGWVSTSYFVSPDNFTTSDNKDTGLRIIDLNNDGLPDLLKGGVPGNAWFNNGTGWQNNSGYAPSLEFTDQAGNRPDLGVRFMDINGDGLQDLLQNFYSNISIINQTCVDQNGTNCTLGQNITFATNTKLNNGSGWIQAVGWNSPEKFTDQGLNIGRRIADVNGDGYADILVAYQQSPYLSVTHIKNATTAFLLGSITNAYSGKTSLIYKQSTLSDNSDDLGFNMWLVGNSSLNNSLSGDFATGSLYSYLYRGGKYDYPTQEFRGFGEVNETLPDNSTVAHFFHQDAILKGREFKTSIYDSNGKRLVENFNTYTNDSNKMIFLNRTSAQSYDGGTTPSINNVTYSYDIYGNVKIINNSGDLSVSGDEKLEIFDYLYNTTAYIVDKSSNYTLFASDGSTIVKRAFYAYDGLASGVTKGDLTKVTNYNNKGSNPVIQYSYDSFGNIIKETQPSGQNTTFTYDSTGTIKIKDANHLGHTIIYNYNLGTGNLLNETRHGLNKIYTYDTFGRIKTEATSPDTSISPTKNYTYSFDGFAPETIKIQTKNNASDYSEVLHFYDGFGNMVQTKTLLNGQQIVKNYFYDSKYRIDEEQNPYSESYSTSLSAATSGLKIRYQYDALDRVINLTRQDNGSLSVIFNRTLATQYDENGNKIDYLLDGLGRIKQINEYNGVEVYNTTYEYKTDNNLIKITDAKGNKFLFDYDTLGRKLVYDDPNMNNWTYFYDANGNLVNQTDGRNITTFLSYDGLNRIILKRAGTSNVTFAYDAQFNGTLANITSDDSYFNSVQKKYTYDSRLRVIREDTFLCYREPEPGDDECEWLNYSSDYDSQDRILKMYLPNTNLSYSYNELGKIESAQNFLTSVNYNQFGKISNKTYSNGLVTRYGYDNIGRINSINTGNLQNLTYSYDKANNINIINDTKNNFVYNMSYDNLNRLVKTIIYNHNTHEHEKYYFVYDKISNLIFKTTDKTATNYTYSLPVHAPSSVLVSNRSSASINLTLVNPVSTLNVNRNTFFNFTIQACCLDNDCWGINVSLDPEENSSNNSSEIFLGISSNETNSSTQDETNRSESNETLDAEDSSENNVSEENGYENDSIIAEIPTDENITISNETINETVQLVPVIEGKLKYTYLPNSETVCGGGVCNSVYYSETKFVYEDDDWKNIADARSLKSVWGVKIDEDINFPLTVIDYNYTSITLNLSVSNSKVQQNIPLRVYSKTDSSISPMDSEGNEINKDRTLSFSKDGESEVVIIDLSDTSENLLTQEIKWGDASTIVTVNDLNSIDLDDSYIRDSSFDDENYGADGFMYLRNSTTSNEAILMRFDTSQIPRQAMVDRASLHLYLEANDLDAGERYNVSVHPIYPSFSWNEDTITWLTRPQSGTDFNSTYLDKITVNNTDLAKYLSWNVVNAIKNKRANESFYIQVIQNDGGESTDDIRFKSKEPVTNKPYLNVTYRLKNLVSTTVGETPFYTINANPRYIDLEQNQCQNMTWSVNATGSLGEYIFFGYANKTANSSIGAETALVTVKIV